MAGDAIEWNMIPYDVQLVGAIALHQGKVAEMKTGEGKTLVSIFPAYLNALAGKGVHVITVNNYLSEMLSGTSQYLIFMDSRLIVLIDTNLTRNNAGKRIGQISLMAQIMNLALTTSETTWLLIPSNWCKKNIITPSLMR